MTEPDAADRYAKLADDLAHVRWAIHQHLPAIAARIARAFRAVQAALRPLMQPPSGPPPMPPGMVTWPTRRRRKRRKGHR